MPLQIGVLYHVKIHDTEPANARCRKVHGGGRAKPAHADQKHFCFLELLLSRQRDLGHDQVPAVALDFRARQHATCRVARRIDEHDLGARGAQALDLVEVDGARGRGVVLYKDALELAEEHGRKVFERAQARGGKTRDGVPDVIKPIRGATAEVAERPQVDFLFPTMAAMADAVEAETNG